MFNRSYVNGGNFDFKVLCYWALMLNLKNCRITMFMNLAEDLTTIGT